MKKQAITQTSQIVSIFFLLFIGMNIGNAQITNRRLDSLTNNSNPGNFLRWYRNPHDTRYFFGPNGYGLRAGEGYYQNTWIFYNQVTYAPASNFSIGGGLVPLFLFGGAPTPVWITPKASVPIIKEQLNLGIGGFLGGVAGVDRSGFGILYSVVTVGPRDKNLTLGTGYGYLRGDVAKRPTFSLSGMIRTSERIALISENYWINTGDDNMKIISFGCRFLGENIAIDGALVMPLIKDLDGFYALPWLSILVPFERWD